MMLSRLRCTHFRADLENRLLKKLPRRPKRLRERSEVPAKVL